MLNVVFRPTMQLKINTPKNINISLEPIAETKLHASISFLYKSKRKNKTPRARNRFVAATDIHDDKAASDKTYHRITLFIFIIVRFP